MNGIGVSPRMVVPELLDALAPTDPRAKRSRRDLRRINAWMGNVGAMTRALQRHTNSKRRLRLLELGCGDGSFLARVSERLGPAWAGTKATLLDRQASADEFALSRLRSNGWEVQSVEADVFDWLYESGEEPFDVIAANLFLHHFQGEQMQQLLRGIARRTELLVAVEPRRTTAAIFFSRLVWVIGCNSVTQHDAFVSVQAGFTGAELSALWPHRDGTWEFEDRAHGWSNHLFVARRSARGI